MNSALFNTPTESYQVSYIAHVGPVIEIPEEHPFHEAFAAVGGKYLVSAMVELIDKPVQGINVDLSASQYYAEDVRLL